MLKKNLTRAMSFAAAALMTCAFGKASQASETRAYVIGSQERIGCEAGDAADGYSKDRALQPVPREVDAEREPQIACFEIRDGQPNSREHRVGERERISAGTLVMREGEHH